MCKHTRTRRLVPRAMLIADPWRCLGFRVGNHTSMRTPDNVIPDVLHNSTASEPTIRPSVFAQSGCVMPCRKLATLSHTNQTNTHTTTTRQCGQTVRFPADNHRETIKYVDNSLHLDVRNVFFFVIWVISI